MTIPIKLSEQIDGLVSSDEWRRREFAPWVVRSQNYGDTSVLDLQVGIRYRKWSYLQCTLPWNQWWP